MRKNIFKYLSALLILFIPLYSKFPFVQVPGTFVSIRLEDFILALSAFILLPRVFTKRKLLLKDDFFRSLILFLIIGFISLTSAIVITKTVVLHIAFLHWLRRIEYFIPLLVGYFAIRDDKKRAGFFIKLLLIVVFISFFYGFGQKNFSWPIIITQNQEYSKGVALRWVPGSHINAFFAGHYDLASFLVMVLPIVITLLFVLKEKEDKIILAACSFSGLWLLVNAASRISIVSYLVATSIGLFLMKKYRQIILVVVVSVIFVGLSSNLLTRYIRIFTVIKDDFANVIVNDVYAQGSELRIGNSVPELTPTQPPVFEDRSTSIRLNVEWPRALRALAKNPLLGTGYSSISLATDNDFLRLLGEVGILGFASFMLILINLGNKLVGGWKQQKDKLNPLETVYIVGFTGALVGILINAVFIDVFEASKFASMFWLMSGVALGLI